MTEIAEQFISELPPTTFSQRKIMRLINRHTSLLDTTHITYLNEHFKNKRNLNFDLKYLREHGLLVLRNDDGAIYVIKNGFSLDQNLIVSPTTDGFQFQRWYRHYLFGKVWWSILLPAFVSFIISVLVWVVTSH